MPDDKLTEGYGPSVAKFFKQFSGQSEDYEIWEDTFHAALRLLKLHLVFEKNRHLRPAEYKINDDNQSVYDYLTLCLDKNSVAIIRRPAKDDGVNALKVLRQHHMRETHQRTYLHLQTLFNLKMENSVSDYLRTLENLVATLSTNGENLTDKMQVTIILNGLSLDFSNF